MDLLLIPYMAIMASYCGGSFPLKVKWPVSWMPELLFGLGVFAALYDVNILYAVLSSIVAAFAMRAATANGLHWGDGEYKKERDTWFSPFVNWLADQGHIDYSSAAYCRLYMGVKGFIMTLPIGGLGAILFPLGYDLGHMLKGKVKDSNLYRELFSGTGVALSIILFKVVLI